MNSELGTKRRKRASAQQDILRDFVRSETEAAAAVIMVLAARITATTKHDVFVHYAAHVNELQVNLDKGGWQRDLDNRVKIGDVNLDVSDADDLANMIRRLQDILNGDMDEPANSTPILHAIDQVNAA